MIDIPNGTSLPPFHEPPTYELTLAAPPVKPPSFVRIPILIACTVLSFILLIAGTATTAISFPPTRHQDVGGTALDGDYKLLGPLLIMAGGFLLVVDVVLCSIVTRDAYRAAQSVAPRSEVPEPMSVVGGPFFLAVPPNVLRTVSPLSREFWASPNAPLLPDYLQEDAALKPVRPGTAILSKGTQPPFNPNLGDG